MVPRGTSARRSRPAPALAPAQIRSVLPAQRAPRIVLSRAFGELPDALLVVVDERPARGVFDGLPEAGRWHKLNLRTAPRAGSVRSTTLCNERQTLAVLGYLARGASMFERLSLAGRMMKETAGRAPRTLALAAPGASPQDQQTLAALLAAALTDSFRMPSFRGSNTEESLRTVTVVTDASTASTLDVAFESASARGTNLTRWLTALPPNLLDSRAYRSILTHIARKHSLGMKWMDQRELRRLGANAFLAVAAGNEHSDAGIAHLTYRPGRKTRPDVALVGKGIVFDTGGVNLKPHRSMLDMHTDMSGSAVALATLLALAELRSPLAADAWLAITENQIGPHAYRPQELIRAVNGVTIQVIHTDAEGRMALADTLALAARSKPRFMLDFATLTGACVHSLTERMSGVLTNRPALADRLVAAGRASGERVWSFPLDADFDSDLESKIADVLQCSADGKGDHILATRFLNRFVPEAIPWAHVDLSAATRSGGLGHINTEITGFGVRFALELLLRQRILEDPALEATGAAR